jgi:ankyrin repeat protein
MENNDAQEREELGMIVQEELGIMEDEDDPPTFVGYREVEDYLTILQAHIEAGNWEEADRRIKSHPEEIYSSSTTALHLALEGGDCPFPLFRSMIEIEPVLASIVDKNGNTPLHAACSGEFSYDPLVIATLLSAYPQAVLMKDTLEGTTPVHMLLAMGGNVNITCLTLLLDVAYSRFAGLPKSYILAVEFMTSSLDTSTTIVQQYPPLLIHIVRQIALSDPLAFPAFLRPFLHVPAPGSLFSSPELMDDQPKILLTQDNMLQVPLHIAARRGASKLVAEVLLQEDRYPGAIAACNVLERKDRYPFHYCAIYGTGSASKDAVARIFEHNKQAVHFHEQYGLTPYQLTFNSAHYTMKDRAFDLKSTRTVRADQDSLCTYFVEPKSWELYQHAVYFLRLTHDGRLDSRNFSVLHAAATFVSPPHFLRCNIKLFPWQLRMRDSDGDLPIHKACKVMRAHGINEHFYWMKRDISYDSLHFRLIPEVRKRDNPITILTEAYPKGASTLDAEENLPLHSAILSGKNLGDGIMSLIKTAPMALATRNMTHRLYPFMLAAVKNDLNLTFELLQSNPTMIRSGIDDSRNVFHEPAGKRIRAS